MGQQARVAAAEPDDWRAIPRTELTQNLSSDLHTCSAVIPNIRKNQTRWIATEENTPPSTSSLYVACTHMYTYLHHTYTHKPTTSMV